MEILGETYFLICLCSLVTLCFISYFMTREYIGLTLFFFVCDVAIFYGIVNTLADGDDIMSYLFMVAFSVTLFVRMCPFLDDL